LYGVDLRDGCWLCGIAGLGHQPDPPDGDLGGGGIGVHVGDCLYALPGAAKGSANPHRTATECGTPLVRALRHMVAAVQLPLALAVRECVTPAVRDGGSGALWVAGRGGAHAHLDGSGGVHEPLVAALPRHQASGRRDPRSFDYAGVDQGWYWEHVR